MGVALKTGISRSVLAWYSLYGWVGGDDAVRVTKPGSGATEAIEATAIMTERIRIAFERLIDEDEAQAA